MRVQKRIPWLISLGMVLAAMTLWGTRAGADVNTDQPGSIVIWPKVIADGTRDTIITLTNTSNSTAYAHCFYVQGTGFCSITPDFCTINQPLSCPIVAGGPPNVCQDFWGEEDFDVILTRQQPTMWRVSTGRFENLLSGAGTFCTTVPGSPPTQYCPGLFEAISVPPVHFQADNPQEFGGFRGELRCVQTNSDGSPNGMDALKGEADIQAVDIGTTFAPLVSEYNAIAIQSNQDGAIDAGNGSDILELNGLGYNACPEALDTIHYAPGGDDIAAAANDWGGGTEPVSTELTMVPCRADFSDIIGAGFNVHFGVYDEFESFFSRDLAFGCWASVTLEDLGFSNVNGATMMHTVLTSSGTGFCIQGPTPSVACTSDAGCGLGGVCAPAPGIVGVVEEVHSGPRTSMDPTAVGSAAANLHMVDADGDGSLQRPGHCRGALTTQCTTDADCPTGLCRFASTTPCTSDAQCAATPNDFCDRCMNDEIRYDTFVSHP